MALKVTVTNTVEDVRDYVLVSELIEDYPFLKNEKWDYVEEVRIFESHIFLDVWDRKVSQVAWRWNGHRWAERVELLHVNAR